MEVWVEKKVTETVLFILWKCINLISHLKKIKYAKLSCSESLSLVQW